MLTDDLGRRVLIDSLRAQVPVGDIAVAVEHKDRVVGDALDDRAKAPFAFHKRLLCFAALSNALLERGLNPLSLLDLSVQHFGGLLERRTALVQRLLQVVIRPPQIFLGAATDGDVLYDGHEMARGTVAVENGDDVAADPQARPVRQQVSFLNGKSFPSFEGTGKQIAHVGLVGRIVRS